MLLLTPFKRAIIKAAPKKQSTGLFRFEIISDDATAAAATVSGVQSVQGISDDEIERRIKYALQERDLSDLKSENEYLNKELNRADLAKAKVWERFNDYMPIISAAIQGLVGKLAGGNMPAVAIAGVEPTVAQDGAQQVYTDTECSDSDARLFNALEKWKDADPDFWQFIETFAEFANSGKKIMGMDYNQFKTMFDPTKLKGMLA
jgi:hypothetical protein